MRWFNGSYTGYFNVRHRRAGHLFQGRFKAHLIEERGYFTEISWPTAKPVKTFLSWNGCGHVPRWIGS